MKESSSHDHVRKKIAARCAIITVSDSRTEETDESGKLIAELIHHAGHEVAHKIIVPDDANQIFEAIRKSLSEGSLNFIILNGGTGISKRDVTVEAVERVLDRKLPGFGELFRSLSYQEIGSSAFLSRAIAGVVHNKVIFALPGSTRAVDLAMTKLVVPEIRHLLNELTK
jgi:molybdopterin adenylyltransferase